MSSWTACPRSPTARRASWLAISTRASGTSSAIRQTRMAFRSNRPSTRAVKIRSQESESMLAVLTLTMLSVRSSRLSSISTTIEPLVTSIRPICAIRNCLTIYFRNRVALPVKSNLCASEQQEISRVIRSAPGLTDSRGWRSRRRLWRPRKTSQVISKEPTTLCFR